MVKIQNFITKIIIYVIDTMRIFKIPINNWFVQVILDLKKKTEYI